MGACCCHFILSLSCRSLVLNSMFPAAPKWQIIAWYQRSAFNLALCKLEAPFSICTLRNSFTGQGNGCVSLLKADNKCAFCSNKNTTWETMIATSALRIETINTSLSGDLKVRFCQGHQSRKRAPIQQWRDEADWLWNIKIHGAEPFRHRGVYATAIWGRATNAPGSFEESVVQ